MSLRAYRRPYHQRPESFISYLLRYVPANEHGEITAQAKRGPLQRQDVAMIRDRAAKLAIDVPHP